MRTLEHAWAGIGQHDAALIHKGYVQDFLVLGLQVLEDGLQHCRTGLRGQLVIDQGHVPEAVVDVSLKDVHVMSGKKCQVLERIVLGTVPIQISSRTQGQEHRNKWGEKHGREKIALDGLDGELAHAGPLPDTPFFKGQICCVDQFSQGDGLEEVGICPIGHAPQTHFLTAMP